ncbi:MAG: DUF6923 family protein [Thermocrispum sp.]
MTRSGTRRVFARSLGTFAVIAAVPVVLAPPAAAGTPPQCANSSFVVSGRGLYHLDEGAERARRVSRLGVQLNAMGYQPAYDRFVGIGSYPDGAHVVTVRPSGQTVDLGPAPRGTGDAYAGAIAGDRWYLRGSGDLMVVDLDPDSATFLEVLARRTLSRTTDVGDWAVNGADGLLYGIDATGPDPGRLVSVDPDSGQVTVLGTADVPGWRPYGAAVVDAYGVLHVLRNADGRIFHVPLDAPSAATSTRVGLAARSVDAAGCPQAWDYGDAPASYRTTLEDGGPRHTLDVFDGLSIGEVVSDDADGRPSGDAGADDDDVAGPRTVAVGRVAVDVPVSNGTERQAFLAGWLDLDGDGEFAAAAERVGEVVAPGQSTVTLSWTRGVTATAERGFLRLRLYRDPQGDALPTGTARGGEVEDVAVNFRWPREDPPAPTSAAQLPPAPTSPGPKPSTAPSSALSAAPGEKPTLEYLASAPPSDPPDPATLPVTLTVFAGVLVPAVIVAARVVSRSSRARR